MPVSTSENRVSSANSASSAGDSRRRAMVASSTTRWGSCAGPSRSSSRRTLGGENEGAAAGAGPGPGESPVEPVAAGSLAVPEGGLPWGRDDPAGTARPGCRLGEVASAPGREVATTPPPTTTVVLGGAVVTWVVAGAVVGGAVVTGAVVGGAVVTGAVVGGAVVTGAVVGGSVDPGGSWASAARMPADPTSRSAAVAVTITRTRNDRLAAAAGSRRRPVGAPRCRAWGRSANSSALKMANLPTHRIPKASSELPITTAVVTAWEAAAWRARVLPRSAAQVEKASPAKASAQNGTTSLQRWERPRRPHAQLRFR
jgi:hypothetical protein